MAGQNVYMVSEHKRKLSERLKKCWVLYLFLLPAVIYLLIFHYAPMCGLIIAFKDFKGSKGIFGSEWVGFKWFSRFFASPNFWPVLKNTLRISIYHLLAGFPLPIMLALVINDVKHTKFKKFAQTITYMPHFISAVVLVSMMSLMFSPVNGIVNKLLVFFGGSGEVYFLGSADLFPHMYVWSGIWTNIGWGSIIYIAALAGVDVSLHESAMIDGANKVKRMWHIDLPCILPTMAILLIMNMGSILNVGYEKVYLMQNALNLATSEVISTYVYKTGLLNQQLSYSTAIGLFNNIIGFTLLILVNKIVGKMTQSSLW